MSRRVVRRQNKKKVIATEHQNPILGDTAVHQIMGITDKSILAQEHPIILKQKDLESKAKIKKTLGYKAMRNQKLQRASKNMRDVTMKTNFKRIQ